MRARSRFVEVFGAAWVDTLCEISFAERYRSPTWVDDSLYFMRISTRSCGCALRGLAWRCVALSTTRFVHVFGSSAHFVIVAGNRPFPAPLSFAS